MIKARLPCLVARHAVGGRSESCRRQAMSLRGRARGRRIGTPTPAGATTPRRVVLGRMELACSIGVRTRRPPDRARGPGSRRRPRGERIRRCTPGGARRTWSDFARALVTSLARRLAALTKRPGANVSTTTRSSGRRSARLGTWPLCCARPCPRLRQGGAHYRRPGGHGRADRGMSRCVKLSRLRSRLPHASRSRAS